MIALIGMVLALVFILVAFFGPWYSGTSVGVEANMYLTKMEAAGITIEYSSDTFEMGMLGMADEIRSVFSNTMYITIIALIFAIISLIGILGISFNFGPANTMKMLGAIFGILTFILAIVAVIYFMTGLTGISNYEAGFWQENAGPGYAWYLMIMGGILALIFSLPLFKKQTA